MILHAYHARYRRRRPRSGQGIGQDAGQDRRTSHLRVRAQRDDPAGSLRGAQRRAAPASSWRLTPNHHLGRGQAVAGRRLRNVTALLDVNLLVALFDPEHVHHHIAHDWFSEYGDPWATCPLTENGALRV